MRKLLAPAGVNLLLGVPGIVPYFLVWYVLANGPLAALGWTTQDPNENDGMLLWLVVLVPVLGIYGLVWGLVNVRLARRTPAPRAAYWTVCAAASLAPFLAIGLF
ncbi:hypothetical protein [Streptomyces nymphaeiformis]|uniref:Integral membrane protein n=1 Tax=Streptomyces nymphaeiformis TaxID=2663842 RepID=A0A7W7X8Z9_9ACTN|nr:hypothetical protein [Streptomyces nymphaeiformis]MBB4979310.1 hypothetical protein [Streptomyces nymphaeiformis]